MTKWLVLVESNCADPAHEDEFNEWYDQIHLPDVLETEGVVKATRYMSVDPVNGHGKYMAVYEVEADDLQAVFAANDRNMESKKAAGRMSDLLQPVSIRSFRQLTSMPARVLVAGR